MSPEPVVRWKPRAVGRVLRRFGTVVIVVEVPALDGHQVEDIHEVRW
jgi:hypothetical protein